MKWLFIAITSFCIQFILLGQDTTVFRTRSISPILYWDYGKTATYWTSFEQKNEFGTGVLILDKIELISEYGFSTLAPSNAFENIDYKITGNYWRAGMGYMGYVDPKNRIGLGFMYASSTFEDEGLIKYITESGFYSPYERDFKRTDLKASWTELNLTTQRYLTLNKSKPEHWSNYIFSLGLKVRYRKLLSASQIDSDPDYYAIPGFGRSTTQNVMAVNLFLKLTI